MPFWFIFRFLCSRRHRVGRLVVRERPDQRLQPFRRQLEEERQGRTSAVLVAGSNHRLRSGLLCPWWLRPLYFTFRTFGFTLMPWPYHLKATSLKVLQFWVCLPSSPFYPPTLAGTQTFFKQVCHHRGGSFIYWAQVTSLTCIANVQSTNTYHTRIDNVCTYHKRKGWF